MQPGIPIPLLALMLATISPMVMSNLQRLAGVTTEAMVAEKPKPKAAPAMPHGGGMGDMDY